MRRLLLMRHAKSDWPEKGERVDDHVRPLNARGRDAAKLMGAYIRDHAYVPSLILCSTSERTRETLDRLKLSKTIPARYLRGLYLAEWSALLSHVRHADDDAQSVLVIAHAPGIGQLAATLCRSTADSREHMQAMKQKFPTGALAVLDFSEAHWRDIARGEGHLVDYVRPKQLAES